jgi:hypothetical protein
MNVIYVVGDRFEGFSDNARVTTIRQFCKSAVVGGFTPGTKAIIGQGVSKANVQRMRRCLTESGLEASVDLIDFSSPKADRYLCHKHRPENSLISVPRKVSDTLYEMDLVIDDGCSDLSDHTTGQHLQGMLLVEAARQAFLSVTESQYINDAIPRYFVINTLNVEYPAFAFPLPTLIEYEILAFERGKHETLRFDSLITFVQCSRQTCRVRVSFCVYGLDYIEKREATGAAESLQHYLNSVSAEASRNGAHSTEHGTHA